jgi:hypothetical protein
VDTIEPLKLIIRAILEGKIVVNDVRMSDEGNDWRKMSFYYKVVVNKEKEGG